MNENRIVYPSDQVETTLPAFVAEQYPKFVQFMTSADESEERLGFSQNLLQGLQEYRDLGSYKNHLILHGILKEDLSATADELTLESGYGFPDKDGVLRIDNEIILYRTKTDNIFSGLERGAAGTTELPTFRSKGNFIDSEAASHSAGTLVGNLSILFLSAMLETICQNYTPGINASRIFHEIDKEQLISNIRDFFQSKGSKLGIKTLFKIIFGENDVDVTYPGDRMIIPSTSTWSEPKTMRVIPIPFNLRDPNVNHTDPGETVNSKIFLKSYLDNKIYAESIVDYVSSYALRNTIQYDINLSRSQDVGSFFANPSTKLRRRAERSNDGTPRETVNTITVESTLGFPDSGVIFINTEGISYTSKSTNQFFGCRRGQYGIEQLHDIGDDVYGPYYVETTVTKNGVEYFSRAWPTGLVSSVKVYDGGTLHTPGDDINVAGAGKRDPREPAISSFLVNSEASLATQGVPSPAIGKISFYTAGVAGTYFDDRVVACASSDLPYYTIGPFSTDDSVGPNLKGQRGLHIVPRRDSQKPNIIEVNGQLVPDAFRNKGTDQIGVFADGVPAYSEVSDVNLVQGIIASFKINNRGQNYVNPTVVLNPSNSIAYPVVENGQIVQVLQTTLGQYNENPTVRITSGEGASFNIGFDNYGRITSVEILNGGQYYNDAPTLTVTDSSGRGYGGLISATVENGSVTSVVISAAGLDYNPATTYIETVPVGSGADVEAVVEYYQFNRYQSVINNPNWSFDSGNGFLYNDPITEERRSIFGYVCDPIQLRAQMNDNGQKHSPIIGWAFDGNPIYGPYGYTNGEDNSLGVTRQRSGYRLISEDSRADVVPAGGDNVGTNPPLVGPYDPANGTYPMGSFVQDYEYKVSNAVVNDFYLQTDPLGEFLTTENDEEIIAEIGDQVNTLNEQNGRFCNTPEFPKELYPDGVFCYFVTTDNDGKPEFPYIMGETFWNRPISQNVDTTGSYNASPGEQPALTSISYNPSSYDEIPLTYNINDFFKYRTDFLSPTGIGVELKVGGTSTGGVSSVKVINGAPNTTKIGDLLYYDNYDTGGNGAEGIVTYIAGADIDTAIGSEVVTRLRSHRQRLDLSNNLDPVTGQKRDLVFYVGQQVRGDSVSDVDPLTGEYFFAFGDVRNWDPITMQLELQCTTKYRFQQAMVLKDAQGIDAVIPSFSTLRSLIQLDSNSPYQASKANDVTISFFEPRTSPDGSDLQPGDLWWSPQDGRLNIYYEDADSSQWVGTQPFGSRALFTDASDTGTGTTEPATQQVFQMGGENKIHISNIAPSEREDGNPLQVGDLWWSSQTGIMYIWYSDVLSYYSSNGTLPPADMLDVTSEWVITDPSATVPKDGASDVSNPPEATTTLSSVTTLNITAIISPNAPTVDTIGKEIEVGMLWWSNSTGKMYIYWADAGATAQWNVTNPVGTLPLGDAAEDNPVWPPDDVRPNPDPDPDDPFPPFPPDPGAVYILPELPEQKRLWFDDNFFFYPQDDIIFEQNAPDVFDATELALVEIQGTYYNSDLIVERNRTGIEGGAKYLRDRAIMRNQTRALFTISCDSKVNLQNGDKVFIEDSKFAEVNGIHEVIEVGTVVSAEGYATVTNGSVTDFTITNPGSGYTEDFIITFSGGGGQGAYVQATVSPIVDGGEVISTTVLYGGLNYTSAPTPKFGYQLPDTTFRIFTSQPYGTDNNLINYSTNTETVMGKARYIDIRASGNDYKVLPPARGLYKRLSDRAETVITLEGTTVGAVTVLSGGSRYSNPEAVFADLFGKGFGATADVTVVDGEVTAVTMISQGQDYVEPILTLVEKGGDFASLTNDIGILKSVEVVSPGRNITTDPTARPELQIESRLIIEYTSDSVRTFREGQKIYQGVIQDIGDVEALGAYASETAIQAFGTVVSYDAETHLLLVEMITGEFKPGENIYNGLGAIANVLQNGQADARAQIAGSSDTVGKFITDQSMVSERYAVIQDSYYYQWFSYNIQSPISQANYRTFVNDIIHPTGFIMFSDMILNTSVQVSVDVSEPQIGRT